MQKLFNDSPRENKKQKPTGIKRFSDSGNILKKHHMNILSAKSKMEIWK